MKGLGRRLRDGTPVVSQSDQIIRVVDAAGQTIHEIPFSTLAAFDWGYVYERHVGLYYEANGYHVEYNGLTMGFGDGGIDLVATKAGSLPCYIQCKFKRGNRIGRQEMEWILFKADQSLRKVIPTHCGRKAVCFVLAVPSIPESFAGKKKKNGQAITYPVAEYFLAQNKRQHCVALEILELQL